MNEILFFTHIIAVLLCLGLAVRGGLGSLIVFVSLSAVLANLFVVKQMVLFGLHVTCSDVYMVGGILGLNLIQEMYGKENARRTVYASFLGLILFAAMAQIHLQYVPSPFDHTHGAFASILSQTPRIVAASIGVYFLVQQFDVWFFGVLKRSIGSLSARIAISSTLSQFIDTVLFSFLALYGIAASLLDVIIVSFAVKCAVIASGSLAVAFFKRWTQREVT